MPRFRPHMNNKKLVLFDIDGTLIYHAGSRKWHDQYAHGFQMAYGFTPTWDHKKYNGNVEMQVAWAILQDHGVSREEFEKHYPKYIHEMHEYLKEQSRNEVLFKIIEPASALVKILHKRDDVILGILTGNAERIAHWKLDHVGLSEYFTFGLYGDAANSRIELAKQAFEKAKKELNMEFAPGNVIVIGDTVHDIRCGKAIGAVTVAVTTGMHGFWDELKKENPDILVETLMDPQVLSLFSLK